MSFYEEKAPKDTGNHLNTSSKGLKKKKINTLLRQVRN